MFNFSQEMECYDTHLAKHQLLFPYRLIFGPYWSKCPLSVCSPGEGGRQRKGILTNHGPVWACKERIIKFFYLYQTTLLSNHLLKICLQLLRKSDIVLLVGKYSILGNLSGWNTFPKIVALIVKESRIRLEVEKVFFKVLTIVEKGTV